MPEFRKAFIQLEQKFVRTGTPCGVDSQKKKKTNHVSGPKGNESGCDLREKRTNY